MQQRRHSGDVLKGGEAARKEKAKKEEVIKKRTRCRRNGDMMKNTHRQMKKTQFRFFLTETDRSQYGCDTANIMTEAKAVGNSFVEGKCEK